MCNTFIYAAASWGPPGDLLGASWGPPGGLLGASWVCNLENAWPRIYGAPHVKAAPGLHQGCLINKGPTGTQRNPTKTLQRPDKGHTGPTKTPKQPRQGSTRAPQRLHRNPTEGPTRVPLAPNKNPQRTHLDPPPGSTKKRLGAPTSSPTPATKYLSKGNPSIPCPSNPPPLNSVKHLSSGEVICKSSPLSSLPR